MENLSVSILGREYRLACTPDEKASLLKSAELVDSKMQAIREAGKVMGADRIAVMAALQFAHELLNLKAVDAVAAGNPSGNEPSSESSIIGQRIREMLKVCDEALLPQEKLF
jgi:cell division protein ZapA